MGDIRIAVHMPVYREARIMIPAPRLDAFLKQMSWTIIKKEFKTAVMAMRAYHVILLDLNFELVTIPPDRIPQEARDLVDLLWYMLRVPFHAVSLEASLLRDLADGLYTPDFQELQAKFEELQADMEFLFIAAETMLNPSMSYHQLKAHIAAKKANFQADPPAAQPVVSPLGVLELLLRVVAGKCTNLGKSCIASARIRRFSHLPQ
jgi:hypothetical protein